MSPLSPEDSAVVDSGFRAFYNPNLWFYPCAPTQDNLALTAPWDRANAVLDPSEALIPEAMPVHTLGFKIKIKEYGPVDTPRQILIWLLGGGWYFGDVESDANVLQKLRKTLGFPILSIGYSRGPFPGPLQTTYEAIDWMKARYTAAEVVLAGVSSGGNLAIVAALDRYADWIRGVCLVAPSLDNTEGAQRRYKGASPWFTPERMEFYQQTYVPNVADRGNWKISLIYAPAEVFRRATKFYVSMYIMGADILREEEEGFVERLVHYGCQVQSKLYRGCPHMALSVQAVLGYELLIDMAADIRAMLANNLCPGHLEGGPSHEFEDRFATDTALLQFRLDGASKPLGPG